MCRGRAIELYYSSPLRRGHGVRVFCSFGQDTALGTTLASWEDRVREQDLGTLFLWRADSPGHPCLEAGLGQNGPGSLPGHHGHVTAAMSPSPPSPLPQISRFYQQSAPSHPGGNPKGKARFLTNLEMSEHTAQTVMMTPPITGLCNDLGRARDLTLPARQIQPFACPEPGRG